MSRHRMIKEGYKLTPKGNFVHREVFEKEHGKTKKGWTVFHIDNNIVNNDLSNLITVPFVLYDRLNEMFSLDELSLSRLEIQEMIDHHNENDASYFTKEMNDLYELKLTFEKEISRIDRKLAKLKLNQFEKNNKPIAKAKPKPKIIIRRYSSESDINKIMESSLK